MKVIREDDDLGAIFRNAFYRVAPPPGEFDRRFDRLDAGIHRYGFIKTADARQLLKKARQTIVAQGA
jgi:hypothetical protein